MTLIHVLRALRAVTAREIVKFVQQRGRLLSALVRPLMWLAVFAAGFYDVFGVSIIPYKVYVTYQVYIVPGLLGIILLFHAMQSSLSMVYDREMGVMRLLLTAPLPRWILLACKLCAGTALSVITCYAFLAICILFDVTFEPLAWLEVLPALIVSGMMLGALWLLLSVYIRQVENYGAMNFVMFPMFFFSSALYPLWRLQQSGSQWVYYVATVNPFTYAVELIRFALYGELEPVSASVVCGSTILFFLLAVHGYNPQWGMIRRTASGMSVDLNARRISDIPDSIRHHSDLINRARSSRIIDGHNTEHMRRRGRKQKHAISKPGRFVNTVGNKQSRHRPSRNQFDKLCTQTLCEWRVVIRTVHPGSVDQFDGEGSGQGRSPCKTE